MTNTSIVHAVTLRSHLSRAAWSRFCLQIIDDFSIRFCMFAGFLFYYIACISFYKRNEHYNSMVYRPVLLDLCLEITEYSVQTSGHVIIDDIGLD